MSSHGLRYASANAWEEHYVLPVAGVRTAREMNQLMRRLDSDPDNQRRLQHLAFATRKSPHAFSADQTIQIITKFTSIADALLAMHLLDHHILGMQCSQVAQILRLFPPINRLEVLTVLGETVLDPVNRNMIFQEFTPDLQPYAGNIIMDMRGRSHVFGSMRSEKVIFLIDTSGSMGTEFRTECGETFNRLEFVVHDLHKILHHRCPEGMMFNIITFAHRARKWKSHLVPATPRNLEEAERFLDRLEAEGGTNTDEALQLAIRDTDADTIYLLSDGEPTEGRCSTRDIVEDVHRCLEWRRARRCAPMQINTVAFLMGGWGDHRPARDLMAQLAATTDGVYRCLDPRAPDSEEFMRWERRDGGRMPSAHYADTFEQDDSFVSFFNQKMDRIMTQTQSDYKYYNLPLVPSIAAQAPMNPSYDPSQSAPPPSAPPPSQQQQQPQAVFASAPPPQGMAQGGPPMAPPPPQPMMMQQQPPQQPFTPVYTTTQAFTPTPLRTAPPAWVPDSSSNKCMKCRASFSLFNRRHHCRYCGLLVCNACSLNRTPVPQIGFRDPVRVCAPCFNELRTATFQQQTWRPASPPPMMAPGQQQQPYMGGPPGQPQYASQPYMAAPTS